MSMKYFTLSALCVLVFCMLLALSGTTDIPDKDSKTPAPHQHDPLNPFIRNLGDSPSHAHQLQDWFEPKNHPSPILAGLETLDGMIQSRALRLMGALLIVGWVLASYKILTSTF